jgi:imidazolonepropionase
MGFEREMGSLEKGKRADFVILNHSDWRHLIYEMGDPPIHQVVIGGEIGLS